MALVEAAKILRKHLNPFIQYSEPGPEVGLEHIQEPATSSTVDLELERKLVGGPVAQASGKNESITYAVE